MFSYKSSIVALITIFLLVPFISSPVNAQTYVDSWNSGCKALVGNVTNWELAGGFVDANGNPQEAFDDITTWGITKAKCDEVCSGSALRSVGAEVLVESSCANTAIISDSTSTTLRPPFRIGCCPGWH